MGGLLETIITFIGGQGIWCALFVWLFFTYKQESNEREERLQSILEHQADTLLEISNTLKNVDDRLSKVEEVIQ